MCQRKLELKLFKQVKTMIFRRENMQQGPSFNTKNLARGPWRCSHSAAIQAPLAVQAPRRFLAETGPEPHALATWTPLSSLSPTASPSLPF